MNRKYEEIIQEFNSKPLLELSEDENHFVKYKFNSNLPEFIKIILNDVAISPTSKKDFQQNFVKYYLKNKGFQNYISNWIILFLNCQFYGIYRTRQEARNQGIRGDSRHIYVIGEMRSVGCYAEIKPTETEFETNPNLKNEIFEVNCRISNYPNDNPLNITYEDTYLFDTGCTGCEFGLLNDWDYKIDRFKNRNNDPQITDMNKRIIEVEVIKYRTASKTIIKKEVIFETPMYIQVENEPYIELYSFIVDNFSWFTKNGFFLPKRRRNPLLGTNVINNICSIIFPRKKKESLLIIKSIPSNKIVCRTVILKPKLIIFDVIMEETTYKPFYDIFECRKHYQYIQRKYKSHNFIDFNLNEEAYKNINPWDIYIISEELNMIIVDDKNDLIAVKNKIDFSLSSYSGYITDYGVDTKIYLKNINMLEHITDLVTYEELITSDDSINPIYEYEIGNGFIFIDKEESV